MSKLFKTSICYLLSIIISITSVFTIFIGFEVSAKIDMWQGGLNSFGFESLSGNFQKEISFVPPAHHAAIGLTPPHCRCLSIREVAWEHSSPQLSRCF